MSDILRDVKIKQLPVMNVLDMEAIMLIEDELDTKQIKVSTIMKYIDAMLNSKINNVMIQEKMKKMDLAIDKINKLADSMEKAEAARVEEFNAMRQEYADFLAKYQSIKDTWDKNIIPDYNAAVINESDRKSNEQYRIAEFSNWSTVQSNMQNNENAREQNESIRLANEEKRISAESIRIDNEGIRKNDELTRVSSESYRVNAETIRDNQETVRQAAESSRVTAESERVSAETGRKDQEQYRVNNEIIRVNNEKQRIKNEEQRENLAK